MLQWVIIENGKTRLAYPEEFERARVTWIKVDTRRREQEKALLNHPAKETTNFPGGRANPPNTGLIKNGYRDEIAKQMKEIKRDIVEKEEKRKRDEFNYCFQRLSRDFFRIDENELQNFPRAKKDALFHMVDERVKSKMRWWARINAAGIIGTIAASVFLNPGYLIYLSFFLLNIPIGTFLPMENAIQFLRTKRYSPFINPLNSLPE